MISLFDKGGMIWVTLVYEKTKTLALFWSCKYHMRSLSAIWLYNQNVDLIILGVWLMRFNFDSFNFKRYTQQSVELRKRNIWHLTLKKQSYLNSYYWGGEFEVGLHEGQMLIKFSLSFYWPSNQCCPNSIFLDSNKNKLAMGVIMDLISNSCWLNMYTLQPHGDVFEIRVAEGYGARWSKDSNKVNIYPQNSSAYVYIYGFGIHLYLMLIGCTYCLYCFNLGVNCRIRLCWQ